MSNRTSATCSVARWILLSALTIGLAASAAQAASPKEAPLSPGAGAMRTAAKHHKYLFIYFWRDDTPLSREMRGVFRAALGKMADRADACEIQVADAAEKQMVAKFAVGRSPMPLVLAVAPNGAITKGFLGRFDAKQLRDGFVSRGTAECMKALQARKLVLLCVEPGKARVKQVSLQRGVQEFRTDEEYVKSSEVVVLDAGDPAEAAFLKDLRVNPKTAAKVTVLIAPPAKVIGTFFGDVSKDQLVAKLKAAQSSCCPGGCCPGGCCQQH